MRISLKRVSFMRSGVETKKMRRKKLLVDVDSPKTRFRKRSNETRLKYAYFDKSGIPQKRLRFMRSGIETKKMRRETLLLGARQLESSDSKT